MMKDYLRIHRQLFLYLLTVIGIFFALAYLYGLSMDGMIYALLLVIFFSALFLAEDFGAYKKKVQTLRRLLSRVGNEPLIAEEKPARYEQEYITLYNALFSLYRKETDDSLEKKQQMMNYYSLWVHQIKTPIAALHLILQNQKNMDLALENELFKIEQYVEMVLSYLRLDSEETDYRFEQIEVDQVIREVIHKYSRLFIQKKLALQFDPTELLYLTDEKWFAFILEQILSNAIKYTYHGGVHIYHQGYLLFIEDQGIGISDEDLPRIFDKGYTGYNGRLDKKSTGIGLYLTKEICRRLGIEISVTSEPRKGTAVCLDLTPNQLEVE